MNQGITTTTWSFVFSLPVAVVAALVVLLAAGLALAYLRRSGIAKKHLYLEILRMAIIVLVAFTLFKPECVRKIVKSINPRILILCDASGSMTTHDMETEKPGEVLTRAAWLDRQRTNEVWAPLRERYRLTVEEFAAPPTNAVDPGTDINKALEQALAAHDDLRAIMLISDGDWNEGVSPVSAATTLGMRDIPVYAVQAGSEDYLPDLDLREVMAPAYGLLDEYLSLPFVVQSRLPRDVKTTVLLNSPFGIEARKNIVIPAMSRIQETILLKPRNEGAVHFSLRLPPEKDEVFEENNTREFQIAFRRELLKVLVVDTKPRWEYRFLRNALSRDPGVDLQCMLLHPNMQRGDGKDYIQSFPESRQDLSHYDVVFLGDVGIGPGELTTNQAARLEALVKHQGSGLILLPGMDGRQFSLLDTPLKKLMPVQMDPDSRQGFGIDLESRLTLTSRGRDHLLTMLATDATSNFSLWKRLPGFYWYAPVLRARPGSEVLAVHSAARGPHGRIPLLVTRGYGSGKVLFMGTDSAWRWRRGVEDTYHYRFWSQVVRWMAHQRHLAHEEGIRVFFTPENPRQGEKIFLHATVYDNDGYPLKDGAVTATLSLDDRQVVRQVLQAEGRGWGVFTGSFVPDRQGAYQLEVTCPEADRKVKSGLVVAGVRTEKVGYPARSHVLREISHVTRGRCVPGREVADLVNELKLLPLPEPEERRLRLWCHPLWIGALIFLLGVYWTGRKLVGMI